MSSMGKLMALALLCTMWAAVFFQPVLMGPPRQVKVESERDGNLRRAAEKGSTGRPSAMTLTTRTAATHGLGRCVGRDCADNGGWIWPASNRPSENAGFRGAGGGGGKGAETFP